MCIPTNNCCHNACWSIALVALLACSGSESDKAKAPAPAAEAVGAAPVPAYSRADKTAREVCINEASILRISTTVEISEVHEHHDCQRLISEENGALKYGPVVGVFAPENLEDLHHNSDFTVGKFVAVIENFKDQVYDPTGMNIPKGISCLMLHHGGKPGWEAAIVPADMSSGAAVCDDNLYSGPDARYQVLTQTTPPGQGVPAVARWDWDPTNHYNYIGVRCGDGTWCEIGNSNKFEASKEVSSGPGMQVWNKGYIDQQYLADQTGVLSDVFATIVPGTKLKDLNRDNVTREAAVITLKARPNSPALAYYRTRYQLTNYNAAAGTARGSLHLFAAPGSKDWNVNNDGSTNPNGLLVGKLTPHSPPKPTHQRWPVVRWGWDKNDERVWTYCVDGCCSIA